MESYLQITQINDFIFCPRSIYYHNIFRDNSSDEVYHQSPQRIGQGAHKNIDEATYSTRRDILCGLYVYSQKYKLLGRIDTLDLKSKTLIERKYSITAIYDGFRYQLYGQYFALLEMGYEIEALKLYSLKDNKTYSISIPENKEIDEFESIINNMNNFSLEDEFYTNPKKCNHCIYNVLCDLYER
ncbi:MAG: type V CRISPR-associated protein Cas4 [Opitutales bacterium]